MLPTRPGEVGAVIDQICKETKKMCRRGVAVKELERTKTQLKGSLMLGLEGTYGRMNKLAKDELYQGRHVTLQEMVKAIDRISPDQIRQLSRKLLDLKEFVVTALGPIPRKIGCQVGIILKKITWNSLDNDALDE